MLPYYIASVNIENSFNELFQGKKFIPFNGICLTDTFQLGETDESEELFSSIFPQNYERVIAQKKAPVLKPSRLQSLNIIAALPKPDFSEKKKEE